MDGKFSQCGALLLSDYLTTRTVDTKPRDLNDRFAHFNASSPNLLTSTVRAFHDKHGTFPLA